MASLEECVLTLTCHMPMKTDATSHFQTLQHQATPRTLITLFDNGTYYKRSVRSPEPNLTLTVSKDLFPCVEINLSLSASNMPT